MQEDLTRKTIRGALCIALATLAWPSAAVVLGDVQVRSALGEPLDVVIPLKAASGESIERACFSTLPGNEAGVPEAGAGTLSIERSRGVAALRIRTHAAIVEPAVAVKVRSACPGATTPEVVREYVLLLDPRPAATASAPATAAAATSPAAPRGLLATLLARIGDTLESLARALVPRSSSARREYIAAMRAANPSLQSLGDQDPIPEGTSVALPDLRLPTVARPRPQADAPVASVPAPAPAKARPAAPEKREERAAAPQKREIRAAAPTAPRRDTQAAAAPERREAPRPREPGFVLRLSGAEVDMSRSGRFDEPMRQKLRERQLVLDADDQVSALLAMRNSLKQLETRVAELQLKLATMPPSLAGLTPPAEKAAPAPVAREPSAVKPPVIAPEKAAPQPAPAPRQPEPVQQAQPSAPAATPSPAPAPAPVAAAEPVPTPPRAPVTAAPAPEAAKAVPADTPAVAPTERKPSTKAQPRPATVGENLTPWLWMLVALLVALALWLALRISRRKREEPSEPALLEPEMGAEIPVIEAPLEEPQPPLPVARVARVEERPTIASDAPLTTRLAENSGELRRRYIEERFPEIANGAVALDDPASVVKGARLFYEDGALPRAVELLQFAIEDRPREVKPWLALFEIFRLERLGGEYAELAARFQKQHGDTAEWRKVRFFGREIDPGNALYREASVNTLETIGPREARKLAAANATFDPIAENWLAAPMDFENEVLANDLRRALMAEAQLTDHDLLPNPMPALRNVEMFTVA